MVERAAAQVYRPSPPISPASFDSAIAEIAARQNELDNVRATARMPPRSAPPIAPADAGARHAPPARRAEPSGPDFSSLERHLFKITSQIEALQRPDVSSNRSRRSAANWPRSAHAITEAMPRRAIELIENEIRSLSRRIDDTRQSGTDGQALAGIERALSEIREVLRSLTPAEQLAGYDEAIRNLGAKLDLILRANDDPVDGPPARRRDRGASLDRLQCRLQRRAGAAQRRRAYAVVQGRPARPRRATAAICSRFSNSASPR